MRIALAQCDAAPGDVTANLERAASTVAAAEGAGADVVVFPELSLAGYALGNATGRAALPTDDPRLSELTRRGGAAAVVGLVEPVPGGVHDSAAWLEGGRVVHVQRKLYLPDYGRFDEGRRFLPGDETAAFDTAQGRAAVLVCNDAWQPVVPWLAVQDGAEVLYVLAASGRSLPGETIDIAGTWDDLLRTAARLLQVVVVFVNRSGVEGELRFWGGSRVLGPWGDELARAAGDGEELVVADVDLGVVEAARAEMPLAGGGPHGAVAAAFERLRALRSP
jgi:predicted amidohydrolase